jgi:hypothetical protein
MALVFVGIFLANVAPAFAPPTWLALSYIEVMYHPDHLVLAGGGAIAATCGRLLLARLSTVFIRNRFLSQKTIANIDVIKDQLLRHRALTFNVFLFYALSPFPSNQLFISYGLTGLALRPIALPFLVGRMTSYSFWILTASEISHRLSVESLKSTPFFSAYFVAVQIGSLFVAYLFTRLDWKRLLSERRLRWLR